MPKGKTLSDDAPSDIRLKASRAFKLWVESISHEAKDPSVTDLIVRLLLKEAKRLKLPPPPRR